MTLHFDNPAGLWPITELLTEQNGLSTFSYPIYEAGETHSIAISLTVYWLVHQQTEGWLVHRQTEGCLVHRQTEGFLVHRQTEVRLIMIICKEES